MSKRRTHDDDDDDRDVPNRRQYRDEILRRRSDIARAPSGYLYHPGQLLVGAADQAVVAARLKMLGIKVVPAGDIVQGVIPYVVASERTIPEILAVLRHRDPKTGGTPLVGANHVLAGAQGVIMAEAGGPFSFALPAPAPELPAPVEPGRITVGILDTGLALARQKPENPYLAGVGVQDPMGDNDKALPGGRLADESGHGTFVTGVVRQAAPRARIVVHKCLDSEGFATETGVRDALNEFVAAERPDIVNLSFGGHADDDAPLLALGAAISALDPEIVVVAASGNQGRSKPFWPAAHKHVIGVGALDPARRGRSAGGATPSDYSNFGWWVDAWALGNWISTFYVNDDAPPVTTDGGQVIEPARSFRGWASWEGTSFATAAVTGAIAARAESAGTTPRQAAFELVDAAGLPRVPAVKGGGAIVG